MTKPLKRPTSGAVDLDHENRIQTLERRIPSDYPHWYSIIGGSHTNETGPLTSDFGWAFDDDCFSADPKECEEDFVTSGDYILFPTGYAGPWHCYMNAAITGGNTNIPDYYTPSTVGNDTQTSGIWLYPATEVWRDNAPFGTTTAWAYQEQHEMLQAQASLISERLFAAHFVHPGHGILDSARDRFAVKPQMIIGAFGPISWQGFVAIELSPPQTALAGASF